mgnify:CR=1 FL=1
MVEQPGDEEPGPGRDLGLDPASTAARKTIPLVAANCRWEHDGQPFFAGEVEPCINGQVGAVGAYFGQDVRGIVDRLLAEAHARDLRVIVDVVPNHIVSSDMRALGFPTVQGRAVLVNRLEMVQVECVARGYLTGGGLTDYAATGASEGLTEGIIKM